TSTATGPSPPPTPAASPLTRRLVTDDTGQLLDSARRTYRPPRQPHRPHHGPRDNTCTFPGCPRPARHGDLDHHEPYSHGGSTAPSNVAAICQRHHNAKHDAG